MVWFGFVRCPYARLVSGYNFRLAVNTRYTFFEWLELALTNNDPLARGYENQSRHFMRQIKSILDGELCSNTVMRRFEILPEELSSIRQRLGLAESALLDINSSCGRGINLKKIKFMFKKT